ncbi:MAG TPA: cobalamin-dependent protein, partial [Spirochaetota bacterium]
MRSNRIALISVNQYKVPYPVYPIGLSYLASFLRENGDWDVRIIDLNISDIAAGMEILRAFNPSFVGLSLRNVDDVNFYNQENFIFAYRNLISEIRTRMDAVIILGGAGFSLYPEHLFEFLKPDYALKGEGEESLCELVSVLKKGENPEHVRGLVYSHNNMTVVNERAISRSHNDYPLRYEKEIVPYYWKNSGMLNLQTKRGCPYQCIYCTYPLIEGTKVRMNSLDRVMESIDNLYHEHGVDYIFITDSVFNLDRDYNREFSRRLIESKIPMRWGA